MATQKTQPLPVEEHASQYAPRIVVPAAWEDEDTGATYVHESLVKAQEPWAKEAHVSPMATTENLGDVESFVAYVQHYGTPKGSLLTWNEKGLRAILDYAESGEKPGRCKWQAFYPFRKSIQWLSWTALATGNGVAQKTAIEKLEDLASDIVEPSPADLTHLLRYLRASVNAKADTDLHADGSSSVSFTQDKKISTASSIDIPASFGIAIPVLKGHLDSEGRPVLYRLEVRLRVSIDDNARLSLRFTIPNAERILEDVYADRVTLAKGLLGDFALLRAAD